MNAGLLAGLAAIIVAALATPPVRGLARAIGAVDAPGGRRVHVAVTPRLGGVAIVVAYVMAILAALSTGRLHRLSWNRTALWTFIGTGVLIAATGAVDDIRALGAKKKLALQCLISSLAWAGGVRIASKIFVPGVGYLFIGTPLSYLATVFWLVAFINAINLIDGLDGLAGGVVFFATVTNLVVAIITGDGLAAVLNAALGGAVLGFLFYNFNPATIFMGDTGSMFLGFALGGAALLTGQQKESTVVSLLVPVIALGLPFADTLLATLRRIIGRRSIFAADREHLHHRLLDLGLTHRRAVLVLYGCSLLLCVAALAAALGKSWQVGAGICGALLTLIGVTRFAGYFEIALMRRQRRSQLLSPPADAIRRGVPAVILTSETAASSSSVWAALERLLSAGYFAYAEYRPNGEDAAWKWERTGDGEHREGKLVESTFPLRVYPGARPGTLSFGCLSEQSDLPPQIEILLQVVADTVEAALVRVNVSSPAAMVRAVAGGTGS